MNLIERLSLYICISNLKQKKKKQPYFYYDVHYLSKNVKVRQHVFL